MSDHTTFTFPHSFLIIENIIQLAMFSQGFPNLNVLGPFFSKNPHSIGSLLRR